MFKKHNFKIFRCNPNDPNVDLFKFLHKINLYKSKLCEENAANKANNKAINKIAEDFEKVVAMTKLKKLKWHAKNILPNYEKMKNTQSKIKSIKIRKQHGKTYWSGCKDYMQNVRPEKVKMTNKVLREKSHCVVSRSNKSRFLKQKIN